VNAAPAAPSVARLALKVSPKASRDALIGWRGEVLKVAVTAAPERGKANAAVMRLLAAATGLPRSVISLLHGAASPDKTLLFSGIDDAQLRRAIDRALGDR